MRASTLKELKCLSIRVINFSSQCRKYFKVNVLFGGSIKNNKITYDKIGNEAFLTLELIINI